MPPSVSDGVFVVLGGLLAKLLDLLRDRGAQRTRRALTDADLILRARAALDEESKKLREEIRVELEECRRDRAENEKTIAQLRRQVGELEVEVARLRALIGEGET